MGEIHVRDVDDAVLAKSEERARRNGRTPEDKARETLDRESGRLRREAAAGVRRLQPDIRAERDAHG